MLKLREREFQAGRYRYSEEQSGRILEARQIADADGTASILGMDSVGHTPDFGVICPLFPEKLQQIYQTDRPTRARIEALATVRSFRRVFQGRARQGRARQGRARLGRARPGK